MAPDGPHPGPIREAMRDRRSGRISTLGRGVEAASHPVLLAKPEVRGDAGHHDSRSCGAADDGFDPVGRDRHGMWRLRSPWRSASKKIPSARRRPRSAVTSPRAAGPIIGSRANPRSPPACSSTSRRRTTEWGPPAWPLSEAWPDVAVHSGLDGDPRRDIGRQRFTDRLRLERGRPRMLHFTGR